MEISKMQTFIIRTFLCIVFVNYVKTDLCPKQCDCDKEDGLNRARCTDQNIVSIEVGVPKEVQVYSLSNNVISELENFVFREAGYKEIVWLDVSYNHIFWIGLHAFTGLTKLFHLNLSKNRLSYLPPDVFWETPKLTHLDLSENIFEHVKNEPFLMHDKLQTLNLRGCRIKSLEKRMFTRLPKLTKLDLSENYMVSMSMDVLKPMRKLEIIKLKNEYWRCTDEFRSVEDWIVDKGIVYNKQCKPIMPKMSEKIIMNDDESNTQVTVDTKDVWNIPKPNDNNGSLQNKSSNLSGFERFNKEFPALQAFILGLEIGLGLGIVIAYFWLQNVWKCGKLNCRMRLPETRRQRLRRQRIAENDLNANLLWGNTVNPDLQTPPTVRRRTSLPDIVGATRVSSNFGLTGMREASAIFDVIRPGRPETPPPPYNECRIQFT